MSTVSPRTGRRRLPLVGRSETSAGRAPGPRRRWTPYAVGGGLLLLVAWFAPALVAHTPLFNSVVGSLTSDLQGQVRVSSASLGWLSPVTLTEVEVRDPDGQTLAKIPSASTERNLLSLVTGGGDPGLRLENPRLAITLDESGSNLERVLEKILAADPKDATPFSLAVTGGTLQVIDKTARREWTINEFALHFASPGNEDAPLTLKTSGTIEDAGQPAAFDVDLAIQRDALSSAGGASTGKLKLVAKRLPLELMAPAVRRAAGGDASQLAGTLNAELNTNWALGNVGLKTFGATGRVAVDELAVASPALGDRAVTLRHLEMPLDLRVQNGGLDIKRLDVDCDWGKLHAVGRLADWQAWAKGNLGWESLAPLARRAGELTGEIDVAALARAMPGLVRLREGTEVNSGLLNVTLTSQSIENGWGWNADVRTSRVEATHAGKRITWDKPIELTFAAEDVGAGIVVKQLRAHADFLQLQGEGNLDYLSFAATYELDRLANELSRFIDLGDWRLAGEGWTYLTWQRKNGDAFLADADIQVRGLALAAGGQSWNEENLVCNVELTGRLDKTRIEQIDAMRVNVDAQSDRGVANLAAPVAMHVAKSAWPFDVQLSGRIERWLARAALVTDQAAGWNARGDGQLACRVDYASDKIDVPRFDFKANGLEMETLGMMIREPTLEMTGSGSFSGEPLRWELREMTMKTTSLNARARDVVGRYSKSGAAEITGDVELSADLAKWNAAWQSKSATTPWQVAGKLQAVASIAERDGVLTADLRSEVKQFAAQYGQGPVVADPNVRVEARAKLDRRAETMELERGTIDAESLRAEATGTLSDVYARRELNVRGKVDYDLAKLQGLLAPYLGESVALTGRSSRPFALAGPLGGEFTNQLDAWSGEGSVAWDSARSYGFEATKGVLAGKLRAGKVEITPLDFMVNEGRFRLTPEVILSPAPGELRLPREQVMEQVRITPAMCAQALAYIAPVLAGVAEADGRFSMALDGGRLPLDDFRRGDLSGTLTVHDVRVSAGPLVAALAVVLSRPTEARIKEEAQVPFRLVQGRIYHQNLELNFPEMTVRTHGSVGLDRTLSILAEMPVPPKWVGGDAIGKALEGQTIRLPIGGTLDRPAIDQNELNRLAAQFVQDTAGRVLQQELGKQLDRLLGPGK